MQARLELVSVCFWRKSGVPCACSPAYRLRAVSLHTHQLTGVHTADWPGRLIILVSHHHASDQRWIQMETWAESGGCWSQPAPMTVALRGCTVSQGLHGQAATEISLNWSWLIDHLGWHERKEIVESTALTPRRNVYPCFTIAVAP